MDPSGWMLLKWRLTSMRELLEERCFGTHGRKDFNRQGFSLFIDEETAIRDINYRNAVLYDTAKEAVEAAIKERLVEKRKKWDEQVATMDASG